MTPDPGHLCAPYRSGRLSGVDFIRQCYSIRGAQRARNYAHLGHHAYALGAVVPQPDLLGNVRVLAPLDLLLGHPTEFTRRPQRSLTASTTGLDKGGGGGGGSILTTTRHSAVRAPIGRASRSACYAPRGDNRWRRATRAPQGVYSPRHTAQPRGGHFDSNESAPRPPPSWASLYFCAATFPYGVSCRGTKARKAAHPRAISRSASNTVSGARRLASL